MRFNFRASINQDFVVIDSIFPQREPFAFRNSEINEYINKINNFSAYAMHVMKPDERAGFGHSYGLSETEFNDNKSGYLKYYPNNANKVKYLHPGKKYRFKLAYSFFLAETYVLLPFFEKNKIPFVFVLYPGGLFGLDAEESDYMVRKICLSEYFRGVIVTQQITKDYVLEKKLCPANRVHFIYGGFVQFKQADVLPKKYYPQDKPTFDICFVAAKYSECGVDKGYDLFIETAKILAKKNDNFRFHVVGGFDAHDIDVTTLGNRITFYGYKQPDFLVSFYSGMDVFLGPNRPFKLYGGNFDGFPLGIDASYCGVALFVADELKMNHHYQNGKDIVIVPLSAKRIAATIIRYHENPGKLYNLSKKGQVKTWELFDINHQVEERIKVLNRYVTLDLASNTNEGSDHDK